MHTKWWSFLFGGVLLLELLAVVLTPIMGWGLPKDVSTFGGGVDTLFHVILVVTGFFFVATEAILVYNMYRASMSTGDEKAPYVHGNHRLELIWTFVPGVILLLLAVVQINVWADIKYQSRMPKPDKDVQQVEVTARQWEWRIRYPSSQRLADWDAGRGKDDMERFGTHGDEKGQIDDVHGVNELHVIQGTRVLVHLKTRDVLHSFFLPNLRLKQDALPGKTIPVWFEVEKREGKNYNCKYNPASKRPNEPDKWEDGYDPAGNQWDKREQFWELACAEYCGTRHSMMRGKLFVHENKEDFLKWLKAAEKEQYPEPAQR